jgi:hypothetical protein
MSILLRFNPFFYRNSGSDTYYSSTSKDDLSETSQILIELRLLLHSITEMILSISQLSLSRRPIYLSEDYKKKSSKKFYLSFIVLLMFYLCHSHIFLKPPSSDWFWTMSILKYNVLLNCFITISKWHHFFKCFHWKRLIKIQYI